MDKNNNEYPKKDSKENKNEELDNEELENELEEEVENNLESSKEEMEKNIDYKSKYEKKLQDIEDLNTRYLRLQADFNNYKRRVEKEKEQIYAYASEDLISQILQVIDNFERALDVASEDMKDDNFYEGMELIYMQLLDILKNNGLEEIKALGEKFDPNFHHGVAQEESPENEEDTVIEVFQKGYKLKGKIIRPSMVKISK